MKRFISLLLATSMAFAVPVFADTEGQSYAKVYAEKAKELFGITDDNYSYDMIKNDNGGYSYSLNWKGKSVTFNENGNAINYSNWTESDTKTTPISKENAIKIASEKLKFLLGDNADKMKMEKCTYAYNIWDIDFCQYIGDYKAQYNTVCIELDNSGNLAYFDCSDKFNVNVEKSDNILDYTSAKNKFIENVGFDKAFLTAYNSETFDNYLFPCFTTIDNVNPYINATTGEKIQNRFSDFEYSNYKETAGESDSLTEAERKTVDNLKNTVSTQKAIEIVENKLGYKFNSEKTETGYYSDKTGYFTDITEYDDNYTSATVNSNGKIVYFSRQNLEIDKDNILSNNKLKDLSIQYVKSLGYNDYINYSLDTGKNSVSYTFYKKVNNVVNLSDSIVITLNSNGIVKYFDYSGCTLELPKFESSVSVDTAFDKCAEVFGFTPKYILTSENKAVLAYSFDISPCLNTEGRAITKNNENFVAEYIEYTDIDNCPQKEYIEKLKDAGIKFNSSEFKPNSTLTFKDLKEFFPAVETYSFDYSDDYNVTKYDIAKIFCHILDLDSLCNSNNYGSSYSDVYGANLPYVALCESLGIFNGGDKFNGNSSITRGECAEILYNFLKAFSDYTGSNDYGIL